MNQELHRLATFSSWPETAKASPIRLAKAGLYFNGQGDTTVCFRCSSLFDNWEEGDDPTERHRLRSSNCPVMLGIDTENCPLKLYQGPGSISTYRDCTDACPETLPQGLLSVYNSAFSRAKRRAIFPEENVQHIDRNNPDFHQLRQENVRLSTFDDWPSTAHTQPAELARNGFFFTGLDDRVQCAFCRRVFWNLNEGETLSVKHNLQCPEGPFTRGANCDNVGDRQRSEVQARLESDSAFNIAVAHDVSYHVLSPNELCL